MKRGFLGKRAMSPLIATVLLIAFAVSLGAMIMNWSSDWGGSALSIDCAEVKMEASYICYAQNLIKLKIKNTGSDVEGVTVRVIDDSSRNDIALKNSNLGKGASISKDIPFIKTSKTSVSLIPMIMFEGQPKPCESPVLEVADLKDCVAN